MKSKFTWIFTLLLAFFIQFSFAQEKTITGVVTDPGGMPIPGVNVMVEGTDRGVQTDFDGQYSITASVGQRLVFSFIGMATRTETVGASNTISVQMQDDSKLLDDVVITGYRSTTRPLSNVAVTTVTSKTIEGRPNANFIQTLQGQVPGLNISTGSGQPGANSTVILRGIGSINGNIEPLYVIDGIPMTSDNFRSLNPNDIDAISVLKDAGATSIYGNRGANGVIVIKTKRGGFDSPLNIKYTGLTSFTSLQDHKYDLMNSRQLLRLEKQKGAGLGSTLTDEEIAAFDVNTNWQKELFRTGISQNHTLSLSSGSRNLTSFTSLSYFDQEGIVQDTKLKRFNFRNNMSGKSNNDKFNYSTSISINYSVRDEAYSLGTGSVNWNPLASAHQGAPYLTPGFQTGETLVDWFNNGIPGVGGAGTLLISPLLIQNNIATSTFSTNELKMIANMQASYKLTDDLTLGTSFGGDFTENVQLETQDPTAFNALFFRRVTPPIEQYLGYQFESFAREFSFNMNTSLNYTKTFAEKHTIDASVFTEYFKAHFKTFNYQQNGLDPKIWEPGISGGFVGHVPFPTDPDTESPSFYVPEVGSGKGSAALFSYFGSVDYDYNQKYGLGLSIRRDATYRFAGDNKWGTFWSVSGRWNIDQEAFMQDNAFDMLKLRASYGTTGNQNIDGQSNFTAGTLTRTLYGLSALSYENQPAYILTQYANPNAKWETVGQFNIGVDFEVWKSRLRGNLDVYDRTTRDLFTTINISGTNGTYGILGNSGKINNRGVELLLGYDLFNSNDFLLTLNFNGSYNKNKVLDIPILGGIDDFGLQANQEGRSLLEFYSIEYVGINPANGNLLFRDGEGNLTENPNPETDRRLTGKTAYPTYQGGFGFDARYKGFFFNTQFSFVADIWRYDYDLQNLQDPSDIGVWNKSTDVANAWTPDNRNTDMPSLNATNLGAQGDSDRYLKDASYVRLRYTSLGYNFSKDLLDKTPFSNLRAFVQAENLITWTKWRGWDAESPRGADQYQYPTPRIVSIGLEVEF